MVTGASRGLGAAIAHAMAAEGAAVAVVARTEREWDERLPGTIGRTVAKIVDDGGYAIALRADLLDPADRAGLVDRARDELGPLSVLVNNAAFTAPGGPARAAGTSGGRSVRVPGTHAGGPPFLGIPPHAYQRHFEIGVFTAYDLIQQVVPDMMSVGGGAVINITSAASRMPGAGVAAGYGGAKSALEHLTQSLGQELAPHRIAVNGLAPSHPITTPGLTYYAEHLGTESADEFAEAAVRLALADPKTLNGSITGHLDVLDGSFRPFVGLR
jgi:NAD(P)-dependent dehydrogenase (short-subunit alcohol dehydrogenase family)